MHLYYNPLSSNSRKVAMTAAHLGIELDLIEINLGSPNDRRRLSEVNPNSMVPVLDDDGFVLWESGAIMQYLADATPKQTLYPHDPLARADVNRWLFWVCQHLSPAVGVLTWENIWRKFVDGTDPNPAEVARGEREFARAAAVLDGHLAGRQWMLGDDLTLADYSVAAPLMYTELARLPVSPHKNLMAWFERIEQLDVWRATNPVW